MNSKNPKSALKKEQSVSFQDQDQTNGNMNSFGSDHDFERDIEVAEKQEKKNSPQKNRKKASPEKGALLN